ncbi:MAG: hypothetical protein NVV82_00595 [Sporocytophaga sp.]|nr:hypothetical protein [Sporocytophaga sp.]
MKNITLTRKELYDLVWAEPISTILKTYFLTDSEFRKICVKMKIPLPKFGYWQKSRAGKKVSVETLSNDYNGDIEISLLQREDGDENLVALSPLEILQKEIESDSKLPLVVPKELVNPNKLILKAKETLTTRKPGYGRHYGMINCSWDDAIDIKVSPSCSDRALRFMDTLIKLLLTRGHKIEVEYKNTYVVVQNERIKIALKEKAKKAALKNGSWERNENIPTGKLSFKIDNYSGKEWCDGAQLIENRLSEILAKLELEGNRLKQEHEERQKYWEEQNKKELIRKEFEKRKQKEMTDFKVLLTNALRWNQTIIMENYINLIEADARLNNSLNDELKGWIEWARKKINWYNPQVQAKDDLLDDKDKEKLFLNSDHSSSSNDFSSFDLSQSLFSGDSFWKKSFFSK